MFTLNNITKKSDLSAYYVESHRCPSCGTSVTLEITPQKLFAYNQGANAQEVLEGHDTYIRERFISGVCAICWDAMFAEFE